MYLRRRRGTLTPNCDRITVRNDHREERFDLVRVRRVCAGSGRSRRKDTRVMHDVKSIHRRYGQVKASPPDPRVHQIRGRAAVDLSRAKDFTLDVDIQACRALTGKSETILILACISAR